MVAFNLNNQAAQVCTDTNNQAMATFSLPVLSLMAGQTLQTQYTPDSASLLSASSFLSPVYLNLDNLLFAANITFGNPAATFTGFTDMNFTNVQFNSTFGEMNTVQLFSLPVTFNYTDPGIIASVSTLGFTFPGFFSAFFINPFAATALTTAVLPTTPSIMLASSFGAASAAASAAASSSSTPM
jgi:hypothetical protein